MIPGLRLSLAITAKSAANVTIQFPTNSNLTASHLQDTEAQRHRKHQLSEQQNTNASKLMKPNTKKPLVRFCEFSPVSYNAGEISFLVVVHPAVTLPDEALLLSKRSDHAGSQQRLIEVRIDWRAAHRLQSFQLPGRRHVETLTKTERPH